MVLIVRGTEKRKHEAVVERMFRLRYDHFIARRGWSLPSRNGLDVDQYDSDDAVYFLKMGDDGSIEATARLNNTQPSSLLADLFPYLIETGEDGRPGGAGSGCAAGALSASMFAAARLIRHGFLKRQLSLPVSNRAALTCSREAGSSFVRRSGREKRSAARSRRFCRHLLNIASNRAASISRR